MGRFVAFIVVFFWLSSLCLAAGPVKPLAGDKCPVCGMFVAKYTDFLCELIFTDGTYAVFDGAKDMFKYYYDLNRYGKSRKKEDIEAIYVTDYYGMTLIDGRKAFYVIGSNVAGPMGRELIPFEKDDEAKEFKADHAGNALLRFDDVNSEIVKGLD